MKAMGATFGDSGNDGYFYIFEPHKAYRITKFQRGYTWGNYQVQGVIDDIEYIEANGSSVGWPSILIQLHDSSSPNITSYDLGDGQQRITTVAILLLAIWQRGLILIAEKDKSVATHNYDFLNKIVSEGGSGGMIAKRKLTNRGYESTPSIDFQHQPTKDAFEKLCNELNAQGWGEIDRGIIEQGHASKMYGAFQKFYDYLTDKKNTMDELQSLFHLLTNKITLNVLAYDKEEDMQRSFSNMNSYGISLEENELIKADLFGKVRQYDEDLANKVADHWTDELSKGFWKEERKTSEGNTITLDYALEQIYNSYDNWGKNGKLVRNANPHWLRDSWRELLYSMEGEEIAVFWEDLKRDFEVCEAIFDPKQEHNPGTLKWEISYNHQIYTNCRATNFLSFMLKIKRHLHASNDIEVSKKDAEFISIIQTYAKYFISLILFVGETSPVGSGVMRIFGKDFKEYNLHTLEGTLRLLKSFTGANSKWHSYDDLREQIASNSYSSRANMLINEAFVYILNQERVARGNTVSLLNTRTLKTFHELVKSREHILPQKPKDAKPNADYDFLIGKLGNTLILSGDENQKASNKPISMKIRDYKATNGVFDYWIKDFLDFYEKNGFGEEQVEERTKLLADRFAKILASKDPNPINAYSKFKSLVDTHGVGYKFYIKKDMLNEWDEIIISKEGGFIVPNGKTVYTPEELYEAALLPEQNYYWKQYVFDKIDGKYLSLHSQKYQSIMSKQEEQNESDDPNESDESLVTV